MSRQTLITLQPAPVVDGHFADGTARSRLPYPVHAWASDGRVPSHLGGYTEPTRIVGFTSEEGRREGRLDLIWSVAARRPSLAEGLLIVCEMPDGGTVLLGSPVDTVEAREFERPDVIDPLTAVTDGQRRREGWT